jgi:uncharacterized Zn-binding protein involved in type VI secretion
MIDESVVELPGRRQHVELPDPEIQLVSDEQASAAGRLGDRSQTPADSHGCPACPHAAIGPAVMGSPNVFVNGRPALRTGDEGIHVVCCGPNKWTAAGGTPRVWINGRPAFRMHDQAQHCGGMGYLIEGSPNVWFGGPSLPRDQIAMAESEMVTRLEAKASRERHSGGSSSSSAGPRPRR